MKKLKKIFRQKEFEILLFFISLILFNLVLLIPSEPNNITTIFAYLFTVWGIIIIILFLMSIS